MVTRARPGKDGEDGKSLYTWIKYADTAEGVGISDSPIASDGNLKKYIGFAYNKTSPIESNVASDYTWALFKGTDGTDGLPGQPGTDGTTYYTWIKYADSLGSDGYPSTMYDTPKTTTEYIGIAVNQTSQTEGTDPSKYTWSKFKGDTGAPGKDGEDGKGIVTQVDYYAVSASKTVAPTDWTPNTPPAMSATLRYLWKYTLTTFTDGTTEQTTPCVVGVFGVDGLSYRYSKWVAGVEYRNDNNPYYRDSNGQGIIDVVYTEAISFYDPSTDSTPPAGYICRKTHTSGDTVEFSSEGDWTQSGNTFTSNKGVQTTWAKIKFTTYVVNTVVSVKITASSEANYDWGYVCGLDKAYSTSDYLAKVSGTNSQTVEITVPARGEHYFWVGYVKDSSGDANNDNVVVEILSISPTPIQLAVGEYWAQMNSMAPILTALVLAERIKANFIDVENLAANSAFIDSLVVNQLMAGIKNGQRVEITPDNKSINIYDADGTLASTFEGNKYTNISALFGDSSGSFTVTSASGSQTASAGMTGARTVKTINEDVTEVKQLTAQSQITIGAGTLTIAATVPSTYSSIEQSFDAYLYIKAYIYADSACTNLKYSMTIYGCDLSGSKSDGGTYNRSITANLAGRNVTISEGWVKVGIEASFYAEGIQCSCSCSWSGLSAVTYNQDFYVSRYFANGLCLGARSNNYISLYNQSSGGMRALMENGGYGFDFSNNGIKFRRNASEGWKSLIPKYGLPFATLAVGTMNLNSTSPTMGTYKTADGGTMDVSRQSDGTFKVTVPPAWGSGYLVQLTTLGRTDSNNPMSASVSTISSSYFIVDTMSLKGTWVNEAKVMFLITRLEDFNV